MHNNAPLKQHTCTRVLPLPLVHCRAAPDGETPASVSVDDLLSQLDDLDIPDIDQDLRTFQEQAGALFLVWNGMS